MENKIPSSIGSIWRKWDLHIHPPTTKLNDQYAASAGKDVWDEYCQKLEESDVHALGITDYFSAEGYFTFIEKFKAKYPDSKKVFFPNIEFRLEDKNKENDHINIHVVLSNEVTKEEVERFLSGIELRNVNADGSKSKCVSSDLTRIGYDKALVTSYAILESLQKTFGNREVYLVFGVANGHGGIRPPQHEGRHTEYAKTIDDVCPVFFGRADDKDFFLGERYEGSLPKSVACGSDAHSFSDLENALGKRVVKMDAENRAVIERDITWVKADLTFEGLKYITYEPKERIFIGEEPDIVGRVRTNQTKYIKTLHVDQIEGYDGKHGTWFKTERIDLNPELVAIIGNKGSGKSAVTDIIGLFGNSHNQRYDGANGRSEELFSFLNKEKFLKGRCASNFSGELHWHAGEPDGSLLDAEVDKTLSEKVEYLPQKYLEKICANIEDNEFRGKLNAVIFGYVEKKERYEKTTLEELITYLTSQTEEDIKLAKDSLHEANKKVVADEQKLAPDYKKSIEEKKRIKQEEVDTHKKLKPKEVPKPAQTNEVATGGVSEITPIETELATLTTSITGLKTEQTSIAKKVQDFGQIKQAISRQITGLTGLKTKYQEQLEAAGVKFDDIVTVSFDSKKIDDFVKTNEDRLAEINELLRTEVEIDTLGLNDVDKKSALEKSLICKHSQLGKQRQEIVDRLDKPNQEYQAYLKDKEKWDNQLKDLVGDDTTPVANTLNWLTKELIAIASSYPAELASAKGERTRVSKELFAKKVAMASFYDSVKKSIDGEIEKYGEELGDYDISIEASLRFDKVFFDEFFRFVNQAVKGSFYGTEDGKGALKKIVEEVTNWQDEAMVMSFLDSVIAHIDTDKRAGLPANENKVRGVFKQMKQGKDPVDLYDYIFGFNYLETKYDLKVDEKDLSELSPGERGGLLLIFYLMLDRRDIPLVIDQPEDNLDNKSVYEILVTFLKKAKKRRQIIMVTHNPNLAVVADAEQIIHVSIDKKNKNDFDFYSGSIENPDINKCVVDILEGTLPAFDNRKLKYRKQVVPVK